MVRSVQIAAVVMGLVWTSLAGAQSTPSPQSASPPPQYVTVSEAGKPPQCCKVIRSWREPNGVPAYQALAVDTGELIIIVGSTPPEGDGSLPGSSIQVVRPASVQNSAATPGKPTTLPESRLVPAPAGTPGCPAKEVCGRPAACNACCRSCNACSQASCIICPPPPKRQSFFGRLFKRQSTGVCTEVVCEPAAPPPAKAPTPLPTPAAKPAVASTPAPADTSKPATETKVATEPAKANDWRESWGKVELWRAGAVMPPVQADLIKPTQLLSERADPRPVPMDAPKQPSPIEAPDLYRDMAMEAHPGHIKMPQGSHTEMPQGSHTEIPPENPIEIPQENQPVVTRPKRRLFSGLRLFKPKMSAAQPEAGEGGFETAATAEAAPEVPSPLRAPDRVVSLPADDANAFWSPPSGAKAKSKDAAAGDEGNRPPPQERPSPRIAPGYAGPLPPPGPEVPYVHPQPASFDSGVPDGMANAFTLAGTRRPIPADFGGTPQEPNGFNPRVRPGQGSPPLAYGMPMPNAPQAPNPHPTLPQDWGRVGWGNPLALAAATPVGVAPLMSVPAAPTYEQAAAANTRSASPPGVPQLLAALTESLQPSERELAAEHLGELNWRYQPLVVESLMKSARGDPAASVRAACVHALAHMRVHTTEAIALLYELKADRDPRVRQQAEEALHALGDSQIQQTSRRQ